MLRLGEHGVEHLRDELLLGLRQLRDGLDLLLPLWRGSALAARGALRLAKQILQRNRQRACDGWQKGNRQASAADLIRLVGLLCKPERLSDLHLSDAARLAELGHAFA